MKSREIRYKFRKLRNRDGIFGTDIRPRLSVYRSLKHIYAQIVDDMKGHTLVFASTQDKGFPKLTGAKAAAAVGESLAKKATKQGIASVVFDRGARAYTGQVKALAEGARQAGLKF